MDSVNKISPLWNSMPLSAAKASAQENADTLGFGAIFESAINSVIETDAEKNQMQYLLSTGQLDNPALLTIASTKAELSVSMLVQLRNKSLDAYNELMRISL